jgi:hypothetical protein
VRDEPLIRLETFLIIGTRLGPCRIYFREKAETDEYLMAVQTLTVFRRGFDAGEPFVLLLTVTKLPGLFLRFLRFATILGETSTNLIRQRSFEQRAVS